ncbi:diacylglycerol/lipid kinase family protein [Pseudonocardia charpentierae]|uniref:Diacylglycerol kinase family protein n=1 Tax=Pseudonocardia charpentierae TaxID=3075545 RepID=A0ABU2N6Y4_9PSEU|nr:diacylglycerol kinase family protein [Pseudonocardia sp. DSM 45834]MDT0349700.1 diacylglycerol kinase family protein [Pseudonocardia sp. DSM 45834]
MSRPFDAVEIVFNPNSTGDAQERAEELAEQLAERAPELPVQLRPTERAGHGREIARDAARAGRPLVVSVSGDGGYNDVVNGLMDAGADSAYAAVLAAGNANDHRRVTRERPLADAILDGDVSKLDLLRMTVDDGREPRYAHSYIGLGITPTVALELEKGGKGSIKEIISTIRTFSRFRPFQIETDAGTETFDSVIFANIREMAKFAVLSEEGRPDDGRFEVVVLRHTAKWRVLATAVRAAIRGLGPQPTAREYRFRTVNPMPVQIDGEVSEFERGVAVTVEIVPGALHTVL